MLYMSKATSINISIASNAESTCVIVYIMFRGAGQKGVHDHVSCAGCAASLTSTKVWQPWC